MAGQNIYDDPEFLASYALLDRQQRGLDGAGEWPAFRSMLPAVTGASVLDLGCGFGWHSRWVIEQGASSVLGIDLSERMLARAAEMTAPDSPIRWQRSDLDDLELDADSFDLALSSLALHYVSDIERLLGTVASALRPGGRLVLSVEHPIYSAPTTQQFTTADDGRRIWPLDNYLVEGRRETSWFVDGVIKQHRTIATWVNVLIQAGFVIDRLNEWGPSTEQVAARPELAEDLHRPWFLLVAASVPR